MPTNPLSIRPTEKDIKECGISLSKDNEATAAALLGKFLNDLDIIYTKWKDSRDDDG